MPAIDCCLDMIDSNEALNSRLSKKSFPKINYRISAVYGSVMFASKNDVHDIFGSTVNQSSKINRFAKTNGLVISEEIHDLIKNQQTYKTEKTKDAVRVEYGHGVYHVSKA